MSAWLMRGIRCRAWSVRPAKPFRARAAVQKALALDAQLAAAHASLGIVQWRYDWDYAEAERSFKRAIALDGNYATAHQWYGLLLAYRQRQAEALVELKQAQQLNPLSLIINANLGLLPYFARRYDEAIDQFKRTLELDQNFAFAHFFLGWAYEQKGEHARALVGFRRAAQIDETPATLAYLGHGLAAAGHRAEALAVANKLQTLGQQRYISPYYLAILAAGWREKAACAALTGRWCWAQWRCWPYVSRGCPAPRIKPVCHGAD